MANSSLKKIALLAAKKAAQETYSSIMKLAGSSKEDFQAKCRTLNKGDFFISGNRQYSSTSINYGPGSSGENPESIEGIPEYWYYPIKNIVAPASNITYVNKQPTK